MENGSTEFHWYALYTHRHQEDRAAHNLASRSFEVLNAKVMESKARPYGIGITYVARPFFPRYILVRFRLADVHQVRYTRGVINIVSFGGTPAPINEGDVQVLTARFNRDGSLKPAQALRTGDAIVVEAGPLRGLTGVFQETLDGSARVALLLDSIAYQGRVVIDRALVARTTTDTS